MALKRVVNIIAGQSPPSEAVSSYEQFGLPFLQGNAEFGDRYPIPMKRCDSAPKRCESGDILLSVRAPVGALNVADRPYGIGRGLCAVRAMDLEQRFLWWLLHAKVEVLSSLAIGSTYDAVTKDVVGGVQIDIPTLEQQTAVANYLDRETARIDALIEKKQRMLTTLQVRASAQQCRLILQGVDPITGEGTLPPNWRLANLGILIALQRGHDLPSQERFEGEVPVVSSGGVSGRHNVAVCAPPGVVTGRYGTIGEVFWLETPYWPLNTTLYVKDFRGNSPRWVYHLLRALPLNFDEEKSAVTGINRNVVGQLRVGVPSLTEQQEIAGRLDRSEAAMDELLRKLDEQLAQLRERRQALITAAVTGQLDMPEVVNGNR
jgi:type I restriction enzyme S subunit